jgi:DNA-binding NtrC family response regulator
LRERGDDIVLVAKALLHNYGVEHAKPSLTFTPDALRALGVHRWPGNVRELQTRVQRASSWWMASASPARDLELTEMGVWLTQVGTVGSRSWGGRPRLRGGPCLRFRQRDEASRAVQGDRPTRPLSEPLPE